MCDLARCPCQCCSSHIYLSYPDMCRPDMLSMKAQGPCLTMCNG